MRWIYPNQNAYEVNVCKKYYGRYATFEEACQRVFELIDKGIIKPKEHDPMRYIYTRDGRYELYKCIDGEVEYFGSFRNVDDAMRERDFLESIDWDWDNIDVE